MEHRHQIMQQPHPSTVPVVCYLICCHHSKQTTSTWQNKTTDKKDTYSTGQYTIAVIKTTFLNPLIIMPFPTNITINASSSTSTLWLVAACTAAAATATAMALGYHPSSGGAHQRGRSGNTRKIPSALLKSPYSEQLKLAVKLALQGTVYSTVIVSALLCIYFEVVLFVCLFVCARACMYVCMYVYNYSCTNLSWSLQ